jgi:hypothetical protein
MCKPRTLAHHVSPDGAVVHVVLHQLAAIHNTPARAAAADKSAGHGFNTHHTKHTAA